MRRKLKLKLSWIIALNLDGLVANFSKKTNKSPSSKQSIQWGSKPIKRLVPSLASHVTSSSCSRLEKIRYIVYIGMRLPPIFGSPSKKKEDRGGQNTINEHFGAKKLFLSRRIVCLKTKLKLWNYWRGVILATYLLRRWVNLVPNIFGDVINKH